LNLENSVEELMRELGADEHGRISYQEFLRRRLALRPEIEALRAGKRRSSPHHTHTPEYLPTSSDNSLGKSRTNRSNFPKQIPASVALATINHLGRGEYRFLVRRFRKYRQRLFDETRRIAKHRASDNVSRSSVLRVAWKWSASYPREIDD
jgi:hypothetical protein